MLVLVNGQENTQTSALDRGLLYGQSVFETIAVSHSKACLLDLHLKRLLHGADALNIPICIDEVMADIDLALAHAKLSRAVLRLSISMGEGGRGYLDPINAAPTRIVSLHAYPTHEEAYWSEGINLGVAGIRLSHQPALAGLKHGNRLEQIIARSQWQADWQEALLLDQNDNVVEATQSNVFIVKDGTVSTPKLESAGVAGVAREYIISQLDNLGMRFESVSLSVNQIEAADAVFLSNSVIGIWPVKQFKNRIYSSFNVSRKLLKLMIKNEVIPNYKA